MQDLLTFLESVLKHQLSLPGSRTDGVCWQKVEERLFLACDLGQLKGPVSIARECLWCLWRRIISLWGKEETVLGLDGRFSALQFPTVAYKC